VKAVLLFVVLLTFLTVLTPVNALTQQGNQAKEEIFTDLAKIPFEQYKNLTAGLHNGSVITVYNQTEAPPVPPVVNDTEPPINNTGDNQTQPPVINDTQPPQPTCPPNQIFNTTTQQCQDIPPVPPIPSDKPALSVNISKTLRVVTIGDIDNNNGLVTQLNLAVKYHAQVLVVAGDYGYSSCPAVIDKIHAAGFDTNNAVIIEGNHDCSKDTKTFNGWSTTYGNTNFPDSGDKLSVFAIDGNAAFDCSSAQYKAMKDKIESSDAWYNIPAIHQPYVTAKTHHGPNGQFTCWDPLFRANGINLVIQAHNHNYQRIDVNGIDYLTVGTGTHDTGSSMYPITSNNWNGFDCQKCIDDVNGITLLDLQIDNKNVRNVQGWFISNSDVVKDKWAI
jgi:hypothetical protein